MTAFDPTKDTHTQAVIKEIIESRRNKNPGSTALRNLDREIGGLEEEHEKSSKAGHGGGVLEAEENRKVSRDGGTEDSRDDKEEEKDAWDDRSEEVDEALTTRTFRKETGQAGSALKSGIHRKRMDKEEEREEGGDKKRPNQHHGKAVHGTATATVLTTRLDREGGLGGGAGINGGYYGGSRGGKGGGGRY